MSKLMEKEPSEENVELMRGLDNRMRELELREEAFWHQLSRQNWIKYGDQNSRFFHTKANQRRERNSIDHIRDEAGNVYDDEDETTEEGVRKIIGDGESTKIWSDPWVPDMPNSMVQPLSNQNQENRPVSVYELVENGCWNEELSKGLFTEECIQAIKKIPLPCFPESDRWAWLLGKGGAFSESKRIWYVSPLRLVLDDINISSLLGWVDFQMTKKVEDGWWELFWCLAWGIWVRRNKWVFEAKKTEVNEVVQRAVSLVGEFDLANVDAGENFVSNAAPSVWTPPCEGVYKINSDAAIFGSGRVGFGTIMRDFSGDVMVAACDWVEGDNEIEVAEALGARFALQIAVEAGLSRVVLEVENVKLFSHLKNNTYENSYFGTIVQDVRTLERSCSSVEYSNVRREGNKVAHHLANLSLSFDAMRVWIEEVPPEIFPF
ncbi:hypothetical protein RDABS01_031491, partial [Bienertia sinuspersici]